MQHHAYSRLGSFGGGAAANAAPSPPSSPRRPWGRRPSAKGASAARAVAGAGAGAARRAARAVLAALLRRQAVFLFAPLLYVAAMLLYMGSVSLDSVPRIISRPHPGSLYRSPHLYARLRDDMDADNATDAVSLCLPTCSSLARPRPVGLGVYLSLRSNSIWVIGEFCGCSACVRCGVGYYLDRWV